MKVFVDGKLYDDASVPIALIFKDKNERETLSELLGSEKHDGADWHSLSFAPDAISDADFASFCESVKSNEYA